jgi:hypothetical protein
MAVPYRSTSLITSTIRDSSVSIVTRLSLDDLGSIFGRDRNYRRHCVQTVKGKVKSLYSN